MLSLSRAHKTWGRSFRPFVANNIIALHRTHYSTQPGLITAIFYEASERWRRHMWDSDYQNAKRKPCRLLAVINVRLVHADHLNEVMKVLRRS